MKGSAGSAGQCLDDLTATQSTIIAGKPGRDVHAETAVTQPLDGRFGESAILEDAAGEADGERAMPIVQLLRLFPDRICQGGMETGGTSGHGESIVAHETDQRSPVYLDYAFLLASRCQGQRLARRKA